jgi:hypothetical protein
MQNKVFLICALALAIAGSVAQEIREVTRTEELESKTRRITESLRDGSVFKRTIHDVQKRGRKMETKRTSYLNGTNEVAFEMWDSVSKETLRVFNANSRMASAEVDRDDDGHFEWYIIYDADEKPFSVFKRDRAGGLRPISAKEMEQFKSGASAGAEVFKR